MVERVRSNRTLVCSDEAFHTLAELADSRAAMIFVRVADLAEVTACHARSGPRVPRDLTAQGRKWVKVPRLTLAQFLSDHGDCCGMQVSEDWESTRQRRERRLSARRSK